MMFASPVPALLSPEYIHLAPQCGHPGPVSPLRHARHKLPEVPRHVISLHLVIVIIIVVIIELDF